MAESWDNQRTGHAEHEPENIQPDDIREDRIKKKALGEIKPSKKILQVFIKDPKIGANYVCKDLSIVPLDVARICSKQINETAKAGAYLIKGDEDLTAYRFVFDWMKQCADDRNVASAPELDSLIAEKDGIKPVVEGMLVAQKLRIPHASFNKFIIRKLKDQAKNFVVDLETVARAYDDGDEEYKALQLREVCTNSIFENWYSYVLEEEKYDEYMYKLTTLRENIPALDEDLHAKVDEKDAALKAAKERRKNKDGDAAAGMGGGDGRTNGFAEDFSAGSNGQDRLANEQAGAATGGEDWQNSGVAQQKTGYWADEDIRGDGGGDWGDEAAAAHIEASTPPVASQVSCW